MARPSKTLLAASLTVRALDGTSLSWLFFLRTQAFIHSSRGNKITFFSQQVINTSWGYMPLTQPDETCDLLS